MYSYSEYIELTLEMLLEKIGDMFDLRSNNLALHKDLKSANRDMMRHLVIIAMPNSYLQIAVPIAEHEIVDHFINGILDVILQKSPSMDTAFQEEG